MKNKNIARLAVIITVTLLNIVCIGETIDLDADSFLQPPGENIVNQNIVSIPIPTGGTFESFLELNLYADSDINIEVGCFFDEVFFVLENLFIETGETVVRLDITRGVSEAGAVNSGSLGVAFGPGIENEESWIRVNSLEAGDCFGRVFFQEMPRIAIDKSLSMVRLLRPVETEDEAGQDEFVANQEIMELTIFPNPFNPETEILFYTPKEEFVEVNIFDIRGARVVALAHDLFPEGINSISWDGKNQRGGNVSSGVYFVRVEKQSGREIGRMVLVR